MTDACGSGSFQGWPTNPKGLNSAQGGGTRAAGLATCEGLLWWVVVSRPGVKLRFRHRLPSHSRRAQSSIPVAAEPLLAGGLQEWETAAPDPWGSECEICPCPLTAEIQPTARAFRAGPR